jgi:predicted transcriptional regulator
MAELEQITTRISAETSRRLRMLAAAERRPLYDVVEELLREALDRRERGDDD